jgi:hypothetical protein
MSWVRIFVFSGVIYGGVVHGSGFESLIHFILHGSIQQLHCILSSELHLLYGSPISRWFIFSMDPFMDMRGYRDPYSRYTILIQTSYIQPFSPPVDQQGCQ